LSVWRANAPGNIGAPHVLTGFADGEVEAPRVSGVCSGAQPCTRTGINFGVDVEINSGIAVERFLRHAHNGWVNAPGMDRAAAQAAEGQAFVQFSSGECLRVMCSAAADALRVAA
jgi:hypothetical protein